MLSDKIKHYEEKKQKLNNTPAQYKSEFPWLKEVDSLALANAQMNLQTAYNNFFRNTKIGFPKFKSKKSNRRSYTTNCVNGNISIDNGFLKLPKVGLVKLKQHRLILSNYKLKSVTISQTPSGKYYASVLFEYENQIQKQELHDFLGLDFSMHGLYKDSNGNEPAYPRYYRQAEERLKREQRKLTLMQKGLKIVASKELKLPIFMKKLQIKGKIFYINSQGR